MDFDDVRILEPVPARAGSQEIMENQLEKSLTAPEHTRTIQFFLHNFFVSQDESKESFDKNFVDANGV